MNNSITIQKKSPQRGDDGHKVVSVRMKDELIKELDLIAEQTSRSRNEVINLLLSSAIELVEIE